MNESTPVNRLIQETSPYLLQHAYNPVDWYPWGEEALNKAKDKDLPILVSIGYSSCHWCHVMERESFEDESIARYMNAHFICIKVDREERPDVDQIYMDAVQAMGMQGGWPLNVFLTPDQKPFYGGTYFQPGSWMQLLKNVSNTYATRKQEIQDSAERITDYLTKSEVSKFDLGLQEDTFSVEKLSTSIEKIRDRFDLTFGGIRKAPKFPMPSLWRFLFRYAHFSDDRYLQDHVIFTLEKIVRGGIFDQVGGGFSRYSVDAEWFAPHFEKMLYDNGQLISLLSEAHLVSDKLIFREAVYDTIRFIKREMISPDGGFYSALDADSDGVEGKYYTWSAEEFNSITGKEKEMWSSWFGVTEEGNWEPGRNILIQNRDFGFLKEETGVNTKKVLEYLRNIKDRLHSEREKRNRPGLDNKILAGWNGMMLKGLIDAYHSFGEEEFLDLAVQNGRYLKTYHYREGILYRTPAHVHHPIQGYLEDYAFVIRALLALYQATFDESWLQWAQELIRDTIENFYDEDEHLFYFSKKNSGKLIARKKEFFDNVIPSSNSEMGINLFISGLLLDKREYSEIAEKMIRRVVKLLYSEPDYLSNWGILYLMFSNPFAEIAIVGEKAMEMKNELSKNYVPNRLFCGTVSTSELPLLKDKKKTDRTTVFVCYDKTCKLPVHSVKDAVNLIR